MSTCYRCQTVETRSDDGVGVCQECGALACVFDGERDGSNLEFLCGMCVPSRLTPSGGVPPWRPWDGGDGGGGGPGTPTTPLGVGAATAIGAAAALLTIGLPIGVAAGAVALTSSVAVGGVVRNIRAAARRT